MASLKLFATITIGRYDINDGNSSGRYFIEAYYDDCKEGAYILTEEDPNAVLPNDNCTIMTDSCTTEILVDCGMAKRMPCVWADPNCNGGCKFNCYEMLVGEGVYEIYIDNTFKKIGWLFR